MKRLAVVAAVLVLAACKAKENPASDTAAAPAMAPAPAADSGMQHDSMSMGTQADTAAKKDSAAAKVTTKK
jgi:serine protease inhibitor ecotin